MSDTVRPVGDDLATDPADDHRRVGGSTHFRYPGSPPFTDSDLDRLLFKGREEEADEVFHSILDSDLFILYAVSGMGKTSLLNAGVFNRLRERGYWPVQVRLNDPEHKSPIDHIRDAIASAGAKDDSIDVTNDPTLGAIDDAENLWDYLTALEVWQGNTLLEPVLLFDQFEELFTLDWDQQAREEFIAQFGEVARGHRLAERPSSTAGDVAPSAKLVIVIREDSLGELEAMSTHVPQILRERFRLGPLTIPQARAAIREPATVDDPLLVTHRFSYSTTATEEILGFLGAREADRSATRASGIDPSQLQLVCTYVERTILTTKQDRFDAGSPTEITAEDLGGRDGLEKILTAFYRRTLDTFAPEDRPRIRDLCENGLISQRGRRLSMEVEEIFEQFAVTTGMLDQLVRERLLRADPRVGSVYYELAHDTLVAPIGAYADEERATERQRTRTLRRRLFAATTALLVALAGVAAAVVFNRASDARTEAAEQAAAEAEQELASEIAAVGSDPPTLVSPADGAVLSDFPRIEELTWLEVLGASEYLVEIEFFDPGLPGFSSADSATVSDTTYTMEFVGAQPGRWRVTAKDSDGNLLGRSEWFEFEYTV